MTGEIYQFWKQLVLANYIGGSYSGLSGSGGAWHALASNAPKSRIHNSFWSATTLNNFAGNSDVYAVDYGNLLFIGGGTSTSNDGAILTPEEASSVDQKADDGKPATGKVVARYWNSLCAAADDGSNANNDLAASYRLTDTAKRCALYFTKAF